MKIPKTVRQHWIYMRCFGQRRKGKEEVLDFRSENGQFTGRGRTEPHGRQILGRQLRNNRTQ